MWVFAGSAGMNRELESKLAYCIPRGFYPGRETRRLDSFPDSEISGMVTRKETYVSRRFRRIESLR
jgi:hypothetical protein